MTIFIQHPIKCKHTHIEKTPLSKSTSYTVSGDRHLISRCFKGDCTLYCVFVINYKGQTTGWEHKLKAKQKLRIHIVGKQQKHSHIVKAAKIKLEQSSKYAQKLNWHHFISWHSFKKVWFKFYVYWCMLFSWEYCVSVTFKTTSLLGECSYFTSCVHWKFWQWFPLDQNNYKSKSKFPPFREHVTHHTSWKRVQITQRQK